MLKIKHFFSSADLASFTYFLLIVLKDNTIQILQRRLKHKKYGHGCLEARAGLAGHSLSASYRLGYNGLHSEPDDVIPFYIWLPARLTLPSLFAGVQLLLIYLCLEKLQSWATLELICVFHACPTLFCTPQTMLDIICMYS